MAKKILNYKNEQDSESSIRLAVEWRDEDSSYFQSLGNLYYSKSEKKWRWSSFSGLGRDISEEAEQVFRRPRFDTKEAAGDFLLAVLDASEEFRQTDPLPKDVCWYLNSRAEHLEKEEKELLDRLWRVRDEFRTMEEFASRNQIEQIRWRKEYRSEEQAVQKLLALESPEGEVPFFSEAYLYEKFGKDYARTILSLLRGVVTYASPSHTWEV